MPNKTRSPSLDRTSMNQCRTYSPDFCEILSVSHVVIYKTVICCFQRRSCMISPSSSLQVTYGIPDAHSNPCPPLQFFLSLSINSSFLPTGVSAVVTDTGGRALVISVIYWRLHVISWNVVLEKNGDKLDRSCEKLMSVTDRLCGLVVRVSGYRYRGLGFDSRRHQIFCVVVGLERGPLSLVRSIEELLE